jgi:hypothetical protein
MNKKTFELIAAIVFLLSLLYVPTQLCIGDPYCIKDEWFFIWGLVGQPHEVDLARLLIQSAVVGGLLVTFWRYKFKD